MTDHFSEDPQGVHALKERPCLGKLDLQRMVTLPDHSLGKALSTYLLKNNLDPNAFPKISTDNEYRFIVGHLYETHDIWHIVTGFETDVAGELGLQAFYAAQIRSPLPYLILAAGFLNTAFYAYEEWEKRFLSIVAGWQMGRRAKRLFGTEWNKLWEKDLDEIRMEFCLDLSLLKQTEAIG